jgi:hypothetical protein
MTAIKMLTTCNENMTVHSSNAGNAMKKKQEKPWFDAKCLIKKEVK